MVTTRDPIVAKFLAHVKAECKKRKIKFRFSKYKKVHCGDRIMCGGFFDSNKRMLAVATGDRTQAQWLALLVHEFNHLKQWTDESPYWVPDSDEFLQWLDGKHSQWNAKQIRHYYAAARDVEWDCECRSVRMIKEWGLPLDLKDYIRQANTYVGSYAVMRLKRKWMVKSSYRNPNIVKLMPGNRILSRSELAKPPKAFVDLCLQRCY